MKEEKNQYQKIEDEFIGIIKEFTNKPLIVGLPNKFVTALMKFEDAKRIDERNKIFDEIEKIITPETLHSLYLEATRRLHPESYNSKAQKFYEDLTDEQKSIDIFIANVLKEALKKDSADIVVEEGEVAKHSSNTPLAVKSEKRG